MASELLPITSELTRADKNDHFLARIGYKRGSHRVKPGIYSLGSTNNESPVFVSANYTLSFDALRKSLKGFDCYILVIDTKGINVWCAAGKGTFGTDEVVSKIESTRLKDIVSHRRIILPQLSAPGVAAHEVKKRTGFTVEYGPVRAEDLPEYFRLGKATKEMRRVRFKLKDRAILVPVEMKNNLFWSVPLTLLLLLLGAFWPALIVVSVFVVGVVLFPMLLPVLPSKDFTLKGMILGAIAGLVLGGLQLSLSNHPIDGIGAAYMAATILVMSASVGFISLNFTGVSTYASRTGARREIFRYIPIIAVALIAAVLIFAVAEIIGFMG